MCGIVGVVKANGGVDVDVLTDFKDVLTHRGPDDSGIWIDEQHRIGLGHRRLSIIDLSVAGRQPMANADESIVIVFNGEIYNFLELRRTLQEKGCVFCSNSDTEVIIHAYEQWGTDAFSKLNGMFSFALLDQNRRRLIIARDRFGEKPLYYYNEGQTFLFASELKALEAYPGFSSSVAHDQLSLFFLFGYMPTPRSIYDNVYKLSPAHFLVLDTESLQCEVRPYWRGMEETLCAPACGDDRETAVSRVEKELLSSIEMRLIADVPVGAFLSGGVDSSLIVSMAAQMVSKLKTFSVGFDSQKENEAPYAKEIARYLGCDHHELYVDSIQAQQALVDLPGMYDEPFADSSAIPMYLVSKFARSQVKVVLSGDCGDEFFGGYTTYPLLAKALPLLQMPTFLRELAGRGIAVAGFGKLKKHAALLNCRELWQLFMYLNERIILKQPDAEELLLDFNEERLLGSEFVAAFQRSRNAEPLNRALYADATTYMVDDTLTKVDRASMAVSLETRIPFLDYRIAEYAMSLPVAVRMGGRGRERKPILRDLLAKYMPRKLFERPKQGFSVPLAEWLRGDMRWLISEHLDSRDLKREGLLNVSFVEQMVSEHMAGYRNRDAILWALISWEMWRKERN
jgi:asparagine synthase (glutamine-hydrolysing)